MTSWDTQHSNRVILPGPRPPAMTIFSGILDWVTSLMHFPPVRGGVGEGQGLISAMILRYPFQTHFMGRRTQSQSLILANAGYVTELGHSQGICGSAPHAKGR